VEMRAKGRNGLIKAISRDLPPTGPMKGNNMEGETQDAGMELARRLLEGVTPRVNNHGSILEHQEKQLRNHQQTLAAVALLLDILVLAVRDLQIRAGIDPIDPKPVEPGAVN
jgi:hypothetical protein